MDPQLNRCVNETFSQMYADGLIYRGHRIVNWDPKLQTNVSDDEVDRKEVASPFYLSVWTFPDWNGSSRDKIWRQICRDASR